MIFDCAFTQIAQITRNELTRGKLRGISEIDYTNRTNYTNFDW